ncbi:hydrolase [Thiotrichales bacterium 19S11-10]|nr:hydrolase [Thiotrichales bacterium 19S11-10]
MFKILGQGLYFNAEMPNYGSQAYGISPKGALDQLSFLEAKILLGKPNKVQGVEIIYLSKVQFTQEVLCVLTGAHFEKILLNYNGQCFNVQHAKVVKAPKGSILTFGKKTYGFRSYLVACPLTKSNQNRIGIKRGFFSDWFRWFKKGDPIRVLEGPEVNLLEDKDGFLSKPWQISQHSDNMGLRLFRSQPLQFKPKSMISEAVADGVIQLTNAGPIVLMRHRQCTGGYPRIYNVISSDIDMLGQYTPLEKITFKKVSLEDAYEIKNQKQKEIKRFKETFL